jgi:hypothetical protein
MASEGLRKGAQGVVLDMLIFELNKYVVRLENKRY